MAMAVDAELEAALADALAAGDAELAVAALSALGHDRLAAGDAAAGLQRLRDAARHAAPLGEAALGRALGALAGALDELGEHALAARTFDTALAHAVRADDRASAADLAVARARVVAARDDPAVEAAWATAVARCAAAGREPDELAARIAAARAASSRGDPERALIWLADLAPRLDRIAGGDATWARGELGALWLAAGRAADAIPLLFRAAREEAAAGRHEAEATRRHQLQLCFALLGKPS